jgi:hypothetical protein
MDVGHRHDVRRDGSVVRLSKSWEGERTRDEEAGRRV